MEPRQSRPVARLYVPVSGQFNSPFIHPAKHVNSRYVRMLKSPGLYGVGIDYQEDDVSLIQKHADIAHSATVLLKECQLIKYEHSTGRFQSTELGRIASHYYVTYSLLMTYNQHLHPTVSTLELFRVFALSNECKLLLVRHVFHAIYLSWLISTTQGPSRGKFSRLNFLANVIQCHAQEKLKLAKLLERVPIPIKESVK